VTVVAYDAGSIESRLDINLRPFDEGLERAKRDAREFQRQRYAAVIDLDDRRAKTKITDVDTLLRKVASTKATATVAVEHGQAIRKLIDTSDRLDRLRAQVATARVDADTDAARRRLDALDVQLRRIGLITSRPRVTVDGVERANLQLDSLALRLSTINAAGGGSGGRGGGVGAAGGGWLSRFARSGGPNPGWLGLTAGAVLPLLPGATGLAAGAGASLLTPTVAGLIGLGGFGLAAKSSVKTVETDVKKLNTLVGQYNAATTDKQRAAVLAKEQLLWKSLDPAQRQAVKNVQALDAMWAGFQKRLEPQTFGAVAAAGRLGRTGLGLLYPSAAAAGTSVIGLEQSTNRKLQSPFSRYLARDVLPGETQRAIQAGGVALQNTLAGLAHTLVAFSPLGADLEQWLDRTSARFEKWSEGSGPSKFVYWVEREGPPAAKALGGLAHSLEGLGNGFAPIARLELAALTPALNFLGDLGKAHPEVITAVGVGLLSVAGGLKAVALAKGAAGVLSKIPGLGGGGGGGGIVGRVLGGAAAPGSSPAHPAYVIVLDNTGGLPGGAARTAGTVEKDVAGGRAAAGRGVLGRLGAKIGPKLALAGTVADAASWAFLTSGDAGPKRRDPVQTGLQAILLNMQGVSTDTLRRYYAGKRLTAAEQRQISAGFAFVNQKKFTTGEVGNADNPYRLKPFAVSKFIATQGTADQKTALGILAARNPKDLGHTVADAYTVAGNAAARYAGKIKSLAPDEAAAARATATHTEKIQRQWAALGLAPHYVGLAEAAAAAGGRRIGQSISVGMAQGIENGFKVHVLRAVTKMADGSIKVVSTKLEFGSPSKLMRRYGQWAGQGLGLGFLDSIPGVEAAFAKGSTAGIKAVRASLLSRLASAQQQRTADIGARSQFAAGLTSQFVGGLNLAGAIGPSGNVGNLSAYIGNYAKSLRTLASDEKQLRGKHLSPGLLDMITQVAAANGPAAGIALATSILSGRSGSINSLNRSVGKVSAYAGAVAGQDAGAQYAATLAKDDQMISLLTRLVDLAEKYPQAVTAAFDRTVKGARAHGR